MPKQAHAKEPTSDFENLVRNGIDFLEKAMAQLDSDPKHSVINFYTAVEIFLKAPLVRDHWTLVVTDRDPDRQKYDLGDFVSVTFEDACSRLSKTLKKPLAKSAKEAFDKVRQHRNRMVHFYHSGIDGKQRDAIKLEQAKAWFELNRFISDAWREEFKPFEHEIRRMESNLIANNHYAQAKYEDLKPKIEGMQQGGATFANCPGCRTNACKVDEHAQRLTALQCLVCFHSDTWLQAECPECSDTDQRVQAYEGFSCTNCGFKLTTDRDLFDFLDQNMVRGTKHDVDSCTPANCDQCQGYHTVCEFEGGYLCSNCLSFFDSVGQCQYCSDFMTGDTEFTYAMGCEHCDGSAGRDSGD